MFVLYCLVLGAIQGLTEFLPVSSSGHLALFEDFFSGMPVFPGGATAFNVLLHLGTLAAVFIAYRRDLLPLPAACFSLVRRLFSEEKRRAALTKDEKACLLLLAGTLPLILLKLLDLLSAKIFGFGFVDPAETYIASRPMIVGAILVFNGWMLFFTDRLPDRRRETRTLTQREAFLIGLFQACALLPGLSRSGSTIAGGRLLGLERKEALRFSFLLSVPAVLGASAVEIPALLGASASPGPLAVYLAAAAVALAVGLGSLRLLNKLAKSSSFLPFSIYCWALGALAAAAGGVKLLVA